jgi:hypothetical protein
MNWTYKIKIAKVLASCETIEQNEIATKWKHRILDRFYLKHTIERMEALLEIEDIIGIIKKGQKDEKTLN